MPITSKVSANAEKKPRRRKLPTGIKHQLIFVAFNLKTLREHGYFTVSRTNNKENLLDTLKLLALALISLLLYKL